MIWTAFAIALFALAAYQDGELWRSGFCAGAAFVVIYAAYKDDEHG